MLVSIHVAGAINGRKFFPVKILNNTYHQSNCLMHQGGKIYVLLLMHGKVRLKCEYHPAYSGIFFYDNNFI